MAGILVTPPADNLPGAPRPAADRGFDGRRALRPRSVPRPAASHDRMWRAVRREAAAIVRSDCVLAHLVAAIVLDQLRLEDAVGFRIAQRLAGPKINAGAIRNTFRDAFAADPAIGTAMRADLAAVCERDPACDRYIEAILYFKGFHAIQAHRLAHWLWNRRRQDFALWL